MAKLSIPRLFEVSKLLATDSGKQLEDALNYLSILGEQVVRALRQQLNLADNIDCLTPTVTLTHNKAQLVNTNGRQPVGVIPIRVISTTVAVTSLAWSIDSSNQTSVTAQFTGSPTAEQQVVLLILF